MSIENILKKILLLERRFQPVIVDEPSIDDTIEIIKELKNIMKISIRS